MNLVKVDSLLIYKEFLPLRPSPPCSYHDQVLTEKETEPMLGEPVSKLKTKSATFSLPLTPHTPPLGTTSPALAFPVESSICPCEDGGSVRGSAVETLDIETFSRTNPSKVQAGQISSRYQHLGERFSGIHASIFPSTIHVAALPADQVGLGLPGYQSEYLFDFPQQLRVVLIALLVFFFFFFLELYEWI